MTTKIADLMITYGKKTGSPETMWADVSFGLRSENDALEPLVRAIVPISRDYSATLAQLSDNARSRAVAILREAADRLEADSTIHSEAEVPSE